MATGMKKPPADLRLLHRLVPRKVQVNDSEQTVAARLYPSQGSMFAVIDNDGPPRHVFAHEVTFAALSAQSEPERYNGVGEGYTMELTLTTEEHELLLRILEQHHHGLLKEIWHTDHREFRLSLREDEKLLESLVNRLKELSARAARACQSA